MVDVSQGKPEDISKSYDFLVDGNYFGRAGTVSRAKLKSLIAAMHALGDIDDTPEVGRLVLPGLSLLVD